MLEKIIAQSLWANKQALEWVFASAPNDEYQWKLISHILKAEKIWLQRIKNENLDAQVFEILDKATILSLWQENSQKLNALLKSETTSEIHYKTLAGDPGRTSVEDILLHLCTHGFHHRGQMAHQAASQGLKFPGVAFIQFTRQ